MRCSFCDIGMAEMICMSCSEFCCHIHVGHLCTPNSRDDIITVILNIINEFPLEKAKNFFNLYKIHYQTKWVHR